MGNFTSCCSIKSNIDVYDKPFSYMKGDDQENILKGNILKGYIKYKTVPGPPIIILN
jgi:hypothetical protein